MLIELLLAAISYGSPVNYEISLAGNFGEPRPNHFHGGVDVKTGGVEGKPIFSIGDGYISNVTIGIGGYGNALYIHHPEGYTSVYCHLKKFTPQIQAMVRKFQYANKCDKGNFKFKFTDLPVSRGQLVAVSGNTGSSQAPHLHLEIHDTRTWNMMDPLDFIGNHISDGYAPLGHGFMAYPVLGEGIFCGGSGKQTFGFSSHNLTRKFFAWGKVGFGIWANDYMEITYNRYGMRHTQLLVDGKEVFNSNVNDIPTTDNMMVNSWGDYEHYLRYNVWYMKSFIKPGNLLPILHAVNDGIVDFNQEREYHITYILTDFKGNQSKYTFTIQGKKSVFPKISPVKPEKILRYDRMNNFQLPGLMLIVPPYYVEDNVALQPSIKLQPGKLSDAYKFAAAPYPLFNYAKISIRLKKKVKDNSKLYIISNLGPRHYLDGFYQAGWVTGKVREMGATYEIGYDDTPPTVNAVSLGKQITIGINDAESGISGYQGYIDGHFVLFEEVPKSPWVRCNLSDTPIKPTGKLHQLKFIATDFRNNKRIFTAQIKY